jgi:hypothetical protein
MRRLVEPGMESPTERIIRHLVRNTRCAECGTSYHAEDVYVLEQRGKAVWILGAVCHDCFELSLIRAEMPTSAEAAAPTDSAGTLRPLPRRLTPRLEHESEISPAEQRRFRRLEPIAVDDVLDLSQFLAHFDGDFARLFHEEGPFTDSTGD